VKAKALLIGCGNIGAGYDLTDPEKVLTHARAYHKRQIDFTVYDANGDTAKKIADHYKADYLIDLKNDDIKNFNVVSITTPTTTHYEYLERLIQLKIPVVICEKPVVSSLEQVKTLRKLYANASTKIVVNYIRRFQPAYKEAKSRLKNFQGNDNPASIIIKYKRGFLNNASHAVDLLEYLFETPFSFQNFSFSGFAFDVFDNDPTLSGSCIFLNLPVHFIGLTGSSYPIFEIEIFNKNSKVVICHSGNEIRYYFINDKEELKEDITLRQENILTTYMLAVIDEALDSLVNQSSEDNFLSSLDLNEKMLHIIDTLKQQ
jgi:hypothetical protein